MELVGQENFSNGDFTPAYPFAINTLQVCRIAVLSTRKTLINSEYAEKMLRDCIDEPKLRACFALCFFN